MLRTLFTYAIVLSVCCSCHGPVIGQRQDIIIVDCIRKEQNFALAKQGFVRIGKSEAYDSATGKIKEFYQTRKVRIENPEELKRFFWQFFANYVEPLNRDTRLKNYFSDFPLSTKNVEIEITFLDDFARPLVSPYIARVKNDAGEILLFSYDEKANRYTQLAAAADVSTAR